MITVTATYLQADGLPATGRVVFEPDITAPHQVEPAIVTKSCLSVVLDRQGKLDVELYASDDPAWGVDGPVAYWVNEQIIYAHPRRRYRVLLLGDGTTVDLSTLQPLDDDYSVPVVPVPGPAGEPGPEGPPGPEGAPGAVGPAGPQGVAGPAGPQGIQGPEGPQGEPGAQGVGVELKGSVADMTQLPAGASQGDMYIVEDSGNSFVWDESEGRWVDVGRVVGPAGPQGPPGAQGPAGPQGLRGDVGPQGAPGPAGPQGDPGPKGDTGEPGPTGPEGPTGPQGEPGPAGEGGGAVDWFNVPGPIAIQAPAPMSQAVFFGAPGGGGVTSSTDKGVVLVAAGLPVVAVSPTEARFDRKVNATDGVQVFGKIEFAPSNLAQPDTTFERAGMAGAVGVNGLLLVTLAVGPNPPAKPVPGTIWIGGPA